MRSFTILPVVLLATLAFGATVEKDETNAQRIARGLPPARPKRLFDASKVDSAARARRSATTQPGATGFFQCSTPLGGQPHPVCCETVVTSPTDPGLVNPSTCYINAATIATSTGDCSAGPAQYAGYLGVCCFSTFQVTGGTFPNPTISNPPANDCYAP